MYREHFFEKLKVTQFKRHTHTHTHTHTITHTHKENKFKGQIRPANLNVNQFKRDWEKIIPQNLMLPNSKDKKDLQI